MSIGSHPPGSVDNDLPEEEKLEPSEVPAPVQAALSKLDEAYEFRAQQVPAVACKFQKKYMLFRPYIDPMTIRPYKPQDRQLYFKFYNGFEVKLIRYTFEDNGFREVTDRK